MIAAMGGRSGGSVARTFRNLAEALVGGAEQLCPADYDRLAASFLIYAAELPRLHRAALVWGLRALEAAPMVSRRARRFSKLCPSERAAFLEKLERGRSFAVRTFVLGLKSAAIMVCFDDPMVEAAIGYSHGCIDGMDPETADGAGGEP